MQSFLSAIAEFIGYVAMFYGSIGAILMLCLFALNRRQGGLEVLVFVPPILFVLGIVALFGTGVIIGKYL